MAVFGIAGTLVAIAMSSLGGTLIQIINVFGASVGGPCSALYLMGLFLPWINWKVCSTLLCDFTDYNTYSTYKLFPLRNFSRKLKQCLSCVQGASVGSIAGFGFGLWLAVGSFQTKKNWQTLPTPTYNCTVGNVTAVLDLVTTVATTTLSPCAGTTNAAPQLM